MKMAIADAIPVDGPTGFAYSRALRNLLPGHGEKP